MRILLVVLLVAGCYVERPTQARFQPAGEFWDVPFPSDLRMHDGAYGFKQWPGDWDSEIVEMWLRAADVRVTDGWGLTPGSFFTTTGPIDPATLTPDAVYLVDVDEASPERGRRFPLELGFYADGDRYAPPNLIAATLVPGAILREATRYATVVTDRVRDVNGEPLGAQRPFFDAMNGEYAFLRAALGDDASHAVDAAVFTTFDPRPRLQAIAAFAEAQPTPVTTQPWTKVDDGASFALWTSRIDLPVIQGGRRPYANPGEGIIVWGDGAPAIQSTQSVRVSLAIPKAPMPQTGYPITMYLHGSGGEYREGVDRGPCPERAPRREEEDPPPLTGPAEYLAQQGIATLSYDFPLHGDRNDPPDTTGLLLYNLFGNIEATLDNYDVSVIELLLLSRFAQSLEAGGARFDGAQLNAMGHSMGQTLGLRWASVDPRIHSIVLAGAGGGLVEVAIEAHSPMNLKPALENLLQVEGLHIQHPLLHAFQHVWDRVDPVVAAPHLAKDPLPGVPAKNVFMGVGYRDGYFGPRAQAKEAGALGVPLAGMSLDEFLPSVIEGRVALPISGNLDGVTAAAMRYDGPFENGHYVLFDQPHAIEQYTTFLKSNGSTIPN